MCIRDRIQAVFGVIGIFVTSVGFYLGRVFQDLADPEKFSASQGSANLQALQGIADWVDASEGRTTLLYNTGKCGGRFLLGFCNGCDIRHGFQLSLIHIFSLEMGPDSAAAFR